VPSRFNARAADSEGALLLWNTYTGALSVFPKEQRSAVEHRLAKSGFAGPLDPLSQYLFDRGYVVAADTDEMQRFRLLFGRQHYREDLLQLILLASEDCNFRCVYCYERFARGTMLPNVREGVKRLAQRRAPELDELDISWFGGEPLYGWAAIEDLAPSLQETARKYGLRFNSQMTTNGFLLTPERSRCLLNWDIRSYQITLDGMAEDHDRKRHARDGRPTFSTIYANLEALRRTSEEFQIILRINFDRENLPRLEQFLDVASKSFGQDSRFRVTFRGVGKWGGSNDAELDTCGASEIREASRRLLKYAEDHDLDIGNGLKDIARPGDHVCYAARPYNFVIGASGKLMKCTVALDTSDTNVVGAIRNDGTLDLDDSKLSRWVDPSFEHDSLCQTCYLLPGCQGLHCPLTRVEGNGRTCCGTKSTLKQDMLVTLRRAKPRGRVVRLTSSRATVTSSAGE
jgi:uncharacterized protein